MVATGPARQERWANNGGSTLNGAITAGATSLVVTSAASFPTVPEFRVMIGTEILLVTEISGTTFTVTRGVDGSTAASHSDTDPVDLYFTVGSVDQAYKDAFAIPDYPYNRIMSEGITKVAADFTWNNQGTATCVDSDDGSLLLTLPSEANDQIRGKVLTAPSTPYKITSYVMLGPGYTTGSSGSYLGPMLRESSTGKLYILFIRGDRLALWRMTNPTTFSAEVDTYLFNRHSEYWLRLEDDGTDVNGYISQDGIIWQEVFNEGRTSFMSGGPDQTGFGASSGSGTAGAHFYFKTWIVD